MATRHGAATLDHLMRTRATLHLDDGEVVRVELEREDLARDAILVHRAAEPDRATTDDLVAVLRRHLETAKAHPAGTTDRLLAEDRERPY
ncbi:hypothetical protein [Paraconexibacter sp. AEG42_29]|uniref:hypothetical protein n=1 Tax=Paraconexibacter sp. AEG42_29 TaxID=2997339 RepID=UPI00339D9CE9